MRKKLFSFLPAGTYVVAARLSSVHVYMSVLVRLMMTWCVCLWTSYAHTRVRTSYVHVYAVHVLLTAPEPGERVPSQDDDHPWNPQARTTTETVLREAMQALVRVQAHMLVRIVVEIRAADIAVELEPRGWNCRIP